MSRAQSMNAGAVRPDRPGGHLQTFDEVVARANSLPFGLRALPISRSGRQPGGHALTILSRNARHLVPMDAIIIDPFQEFPSANK
jgi:hypothetical protein